ncbi:hypothetical protein ACFJGW_14915 [Burkholderiaceae bacterium UC74_6]
MLAKMKGALAKGGVGRMTTSEYQANLNGMNMFFGAVLGLVLAGSEKLNAWQFGVLLGSLAAIVITVLYITSSKYRFAYSLLALLYAWSLPSAMDFMLRSHDTVPDKVRPTLLVWILMTMMVEFWAREKPEAAAEKTED